jgi:hypothetical protein
MPRTSCLAVTIKIRRLGSEKQEVFATFLQASNRGDSRAATVIKEKKKNRKGTNPNGKRPY